MIIPTITISLDLDTGVYTLMASSYGYTMPAGPRLFRAPPHPAIKFVHDTESAAEADAVKLRQHIAERWGKTVSKKKARQAGAD